MASPSALRRNSTISRGKNNWQERPRPDPSTIDPVLKMGGLSRRRNRPRHPGDRSCVRSAPGKPDAVNFVTRAYCFWGRDAVLDHFRTIFAGTLAICIRSKRDADHTPRPGRCPHLRAHADYRGRGCPSRHNLCIGKLSGRTGNSYAASFSALTLTVTITPSFDQSYVIEPPSWPDMLRLTSLLP